MRGVVATSACVLAGCAQLAGIDKTTGPGPSTLELDRVSVGATIVQTGENLTGATATFLVDNANEPSGFTDVTPTLDGSTWSAEITDGQPQMYVTLADDPAPRLYDVGRNVLLSRAVFEHPNSTAATDATQMITTTLTIPPYNGTDTYDLYVVGAWAARPFPAGELPAASGTTINATFPYTTATSLTASPLQEMTADDAALVLGYAGGKLVAALDHPGYDPASATPLAGAVTAVTADQTLAIPVDFTAIQGRFAAPLPAVVAGTVSWAVTAAPGSASGLTAGPQLVAGTVAMADTMIAGTFGNPFVATRPWPSTFRITASASRGWMPSGSTIGATLTATLAEITASGAFDAQLSGALPTTITVGSTALSADGTSLPIDPVAPVLVTIGTDRTGASLYTVDLMELVPDSATTPTALVLAPRLHATSVLPSFRIPPAAFVTGHTYTLRATAITGGWPSLADGNLQDRSLPVTVGQFDSATFTVVTP